MILSEIKNLNHSEEFIKIVAKLRPDNSEVVMKLADWWRDEGADIFEARPDLAESAMKEKFKELK